MRALLTDAHIRSVVAGMRGLGRAGVEVVALGRSRSAAGIWSRHVQARAFGPDVEQPDGFLGAVASAAREHGPVVVYPGQECSLDVLLNGWGPGIDDAILPFPGPEPVLMLRDKRQVAERAVAAGLAAIPTVAEGTAAELLAAGLRAPLAIKPPLPSPALGGTKVVASDAALRALLERLPPKLGVIAQRVAGGPKTSVCLVMDRDGSVAAVTQHSTRRSYPVGAGSTALATSVAPDRQLVERVRETLASAGFWGLAEVELIDTGDGLAPIDVNPRYYGTLPLSLASGPNLPAVWHAVATGGERPAPAVYRAGVTYRWLEADFFGTLNGHRELLADGGRRPRVGAMWAADDPVSSLMLTAGGIRRRVRNRVRNRVRG